MTDFDPTWGTASAKLLIKRVAEMDYPAPLGTEGLDYGAGERTAEEWMKVRNGVITSAGEHMKLVPRGTTEWAWMRDLYNEALAATVDLPYADGLGWCDLIAEARIYGGQTWREAHDGHPEEERIVTEACAEAAADMRGDCA